METRLRLYAIAIMARHPDTGRTQATALYAVAASRDEAYVTAYKTAYDEWPPIFGWEQHAASVYAIPNTLYTLKDQ